MKRKLVTIILAGALAVASAFTAFAGWEQTGATWKYQNAGTYYNDGWHWIDGNGDGLAECYFFNIDSTMLSNTTTPDNFTVNESGAWTVNGIVQTKVLNDDTSSTGHTNNSTSNNQSQPQVENIGNGAVETPGTEAPSTSSTEDEQLERWRAEAAELGDRPDGTLGGGQGADGEWYN